MSKYTDKAKSLRADQAVHYNCAQAVLLAFASKFGLDEQAAFRLTANFGSGMKRGSVCGAITGGLMALGLAGADDTATVAAYHQALRDSHAELLDCAELLRVNKERGGEHKAHCDGMVLECVALVERLLREKGRLQ